MRVGATLTALATLAICCVVMAARSGAALCSRRVALPVMGAMPMDTMPANGAAMPVMHGIMLCPIVLCLIVASVGLSAAAVLIAACDPHRSTTGRRTIRAIAHLNVTRSSGLLALGAVAAGVSMEMLDADPSATAVSRLLLIGIALGGSLVLTLLAQTLGRIALAFCSRLWFALSRAILVRATARFRYVARSCGAAANSRDLQALARAHGLRAPPQTLSSVNFFF